MPPTSEHVLAVHDVLPERYRLPLIVLDATGMRLGELEGLRWGDIDEQRGRWRVSRAVAKTGHGRWVNVQPLVFNAVLELVPRDDRSADRKVFQGFGGARFRTAINRACTAAGVPVFRPTISGIGVSRFSIWAACRGRESESMSASATSR